MQRTDLFQQNATRVELDQRSRDARLRLECAERLLGVWPLPRRSLLRRLLRYLRLQTYRVAQGSVESTCTRQRETRGSGDDGDPAVGSPMVSPGIWPGCSGSARISPGCLYAGRPHPEPDRTTRAVARQCSKPWDHWCGRGDLNSHVLSDNRF
jgi:hypothetical protein